MHRAKGDRFVHASVLPVCDNDHTRAFTIGLFIGCIRTHAHGRQVTSILVKMTSPRDNRIYHCISGLLEANFKIESQW